MTLVEGVGDEVIQFFVALIVIVIAVLAWRSTGITDRQIFRTVLILERRNRMRQVLADSSNLTPNRALTTSIDSNDTGQTEVPVDATEEGATGGTAEAEEEESEEASDIGSATAPKDSPPDGGETPNTLRNRRLAFFHRQVTLLEQNTAGEGDQDISVPPAVEDSQSEEDSIRIRLKYLNDDQKMVDGRLHELLGDFRRRHFATELSAHKLVRLIFNGQVLSSDTETLQQLGLFDNCVVHCLVHTPRPGSGGSGSSQQSSQTQNVAGDINGGRTTRGDDGGREWDLGNVLLACLSVALGVAWYCRLQYAAFFSATTTVALVGLTGVVAITLLGTYVPDQEILRQ